MNTLDFHNENSLRSYPIKDGLSRTSTDGLFTIPDDFLVDMVLAVSAEASQQFYISKLTNTNDTVLITVSDGSNVVAGSFNIQLANHQPGTDYVFTPSEAFAGANGKCTVWDTTGMRAAPLGSYSFVKQATELCMRVVVPCLTAIKRLTFVDANGLQQTLTGNVTVEGESNLRFRYENSQLYMDAGEGLGLNKDCTTLSPPIRTINGVEPDANGDFVIVPADCSALEPITNGLIMKDTCAKPCMGCTELSELTDRAAAVESDLLKLKTFVDDINAKVAQLTTLAAYTYDCQDCN